MWKNAFKSFTLLSLYLSKFAANADNVGICAPSLDNTCDPAASAQPYKYGSMLENKQQPSQIYLSVKGKQLATDMLTYSMDAEPKAENLLALMSKIKKSEIQRVLSSTDINGNTILHNLVANLIQFTLTNNPLTARRRVFNALSAINVVASSMDKQDQLNLKQATAHEVVIGFSMIKNGITYSQLSQVEQAREQVLMGLRIILDTSMRMTMLRKEVLGVNRATLLNMKAPILLLEHHYEDAIQQFFIKDFCKYIKSHGIEVIGLEFDFETPLESRKNYYAADVLSTHLPSRRAAQNIMSKFDAIESEQIPSIALDILPCYSEEYRYIRQFSFSNFGLMNIIRGNRDLGIAYNAALASLRDGGRILINCGLAHAEGIIQAFYRMTHKNPKILIVSNPSSIPSEVLEFSDRSQAAYDAEVALLQEKYGAKVLDYSSKSAKAKYRAM